MKKIYLTFFITALSGLAWAELDLSQLCLGKNMNDVLAHPVDCRGYILCAAEPSEHYCEIGFHFDTERLVCNWPENVNCQLTSQPTEDSKDSVKPVVYASLMALDLTTGEVIDPMKGYDPARVVCRHFGAYFLPNPEQCRSYYLCAYGHMHELSCGPDTLWNYTTQQCIASHKADCYHLAEEEKKEINESLSSLAVKNSAVCYPVNTSTTTTEAYHFAGADHTKITTITTTPIPLPLITPQLSVTTSLKMPNSSHTYRIACPLRRQSYVAHPKDCSKYFMCIMGTPVLTSCPEGLLWDSKREYCDLNKNVECV